MQIGYRWHSLLRYLSQGFLSFLRRPRLRHRIYLFGLKRRPRPSLAAIKDDLPVDVVIPVIEQDLATLPMVIEGARRNIAHQVGNIFIVGPENAKIRDKCEEHACIFVNEDTILPIKKRDISLRPNGVDRSGWIFQQLLKLSADSLSSCEHILILDADTVLIRPQRFVLYGQPIYRISDELHLPYFRNISLLTGREIHPRFSFVAHHMLFDKSGLVELRNFIEKRNNGPWYEEILRSISLAESSGFSEYELFGHFISQYRSNCLIEYWDNRALTRNMLGSLDALERLYVHRYKSVSFHWYMSQPG